MKFPERIYTLDEFRKARVAIAEGHKHELSVVGDDSFKGLVEKILGLIELAEYEALIRIYIREIRQIEGISQLRETEATVWLNKVVAEDSIEGARFIVQKVLQMQAYIEGRPWYILGELPAVKGSVEFLRRLRERLKDPMLISKCDRVIKEWTVDAVT